MDYQDGSFATTTYNADSTVATSRTRAVLTLTYAYDAANRPLSVVPSGTPTATLAPLDSGNAMSWDVLSRPTSQRRGDGPEVQVPGFDLGTFTGFEREYNTLDQITSIGALGTEPQTVNLGANWSWGGAGRLWGMTTKGSLGTVVRFGYIGGGGVQPPTGSPDSQWRLGTMTWGSNSGAAEGATVTEALPKVWGQFGFGYRGHSGDPRDGAKVGRLAMSVGNDHFAGIVVGHNDDVIVAPLKK